jgi:hypothetical protein
VSPRPSAHLSCLLWLSRPVRATAKDPSNVDTARSPGMSRNFGGVPQSDFKKPYSGGAGKKKGRYD